MAYFIVGLVCFVGGIVSSAVVRSFVSKESAKVLSFAKKEETAVTNELKKL